MVAQHVGADRELSSPSNSARTAQDARAGVGHSDNQSQREPLQNGLSKRDQSRRSADAHDRKRFAQRSTSSKSVLRMTKMLVIVSSSFLLLNLPSHSIRVYYFIVSWMGRYELITHRLQSCLKLFR